MTNDPYRILVSEVMLQQTQVDRVIPKYRAFLKQFKDVRALARAPLRDVLIAWQGLGYNRRAQALHAAARMIVREHHARVPRSVEALVALPGVGVYTAGAVCAFAYHMPEVLLETNIRAVLLHHLLPHREAVPDTELFVLARALLDTKKPHEWQWALMDYGAFLKVSGVHTNAQSKHYVKQSKFAGSDREVRGAILRHLANTQGHASRTLTMELSFDPARVTAQVQKLAREGLLSVHGSRVALA